MKTTMLILVVILSGCGPISPSGPKNQCHSATRSDNTFLAAEIGVTRPYNVESGMGFSPANHADGVKLTQVYTDCSKFEYVFLNDFLVSKSR
jgi:hypothetical protein